MLKSHASPNRFPNGEQNNFFKYPIRAYDTEIIEEIPILVSTVIVRYLIMFNSAFPNCLSYTIRGPTFVDTEASA